jgi:DNA-binding transcriptional LysR family regulator
VIAAAEHGSFRAAAIALGVRASAISRRIRDLEDEIGVALFVRHQGGVSLTYAGQRFFNRTQKALNQISYAAKDAGAARRGEQGALQIGIFASLASGFLAELLQAYVARNPGIRPNVIEGDAALHIAAVQQHRIDIAFLSGHPTVPSCDVAHLWNEARRSHAPARGDRDALHRDFAASGSDVDPSGLRPRPVQRLRRASDIMAALSLRPPSGRRGQRRRRSSQASRLETGA